MLIHEEQSNTINQLLKSS